MNLKQGQVVVAVVAVLVVTAWNEPQTRTVASSKSPTNTSDNRMWQIKTNKKLLPQLLTPSPKMTITITAPTSADTTNNNKDVPTTNNKKDLPTITGRLLCYVSIGEDVNLGKAKHRIWISLFSASIPPFDLQFYQSLFFYYFYFYFYIYLYFYFNFFSFSSSLSASSYFSDHSPSHCSVSSYPSFVSVFVLCLLTLFCLLFFLVFLFFVFFFVGQLVGKHSRESANTYLRMVIVGCWLAASLPSNSAAAAAIHMITH